MTDFNKLNDVLTAEEKASFTLRALYSEYGYKRYRMSKFEEYDLYAGKKDYLVSESIITFTDTDGKLLALKPDVTLSILKSVEKSTEGINKLQYTESVYRAKGKDGFKELTQTGIELIGGLSPSDIAEAVFLAYRSLEKINNSFALEISHLDLVDAVISETGLDEANKKQVIENLEKKNLAGIKKVCIAAGLDKEKTKSICTLSEAYGEPQKVINELYGAVSGDRAKKALEELSSLCEKLSKMGAGKEICIDLSLNANRKYYNGIAFGGFIEGAPECILKGGQYDKLTESMGVRASAIGFAVYLDGLDRL